jgi:hypothetical protein
VAFLLAISGMPWLIGFLNSKKPSLLKSQPVQSAPSTSAAPTQRLRKQDFSRKLIENQNKSRLKAAFVLIIEQ